MKPIKKGKNIEENIKREAIIEGYKESLESLVWTIISIKNGDMGKSAYLESVNMVEVFADRLRKLDVEDDGIDDIEESIYQNVYKTCANAYWSKRLYEDIGVPDDLNIFQDNNPFVLEAYFRSIKEVLEENDIEPSYNKEMFYKDMYDQLKKDIYKTQVAIEDEVLSEEDEEYKLALKTLDNLEEEI